MGIPNQYYLGGKPEIQVETLDTEGNYFTPVEMRLSITLPDDTVFTVSGADMSTGTNYLYYDYKPEQVGFYKYVTWVKDAQGREDVASSGFEVLSE